MLTAQCSITGKFNHREKAWLVLWEAKLVVEMPPGVLILYPSSLFLHFNVNVEGELHIVAHISNGQ